MPSPNEGDHVALGTSSETNDLLSTMPTYLTSSHTRITGRTAPLERGALMSGILRSHHSSIPFHEQAA